MKKLLCITLVLALVLSLGACKKKDGQANQVEAITYTEQEYEALLNEKLQLEKELAIYDDSYKSIGTFSKFNLITAGRKGFNKIKDKIVLEDEIVSSSLAAVNPIGFEASISLGNDISIRSGDWGVKAGTSDVHLNLNNISGNIKIFEYVNEFDNSTVVEDWLEPYCTKNNLTISKTKQLYINESLAGAEVTSTIDILDSTSEGKEMTVPALSIIDSSAVASWGLQEDSEVPIKLLTDSDNKKSAFYKVGLANISGILIQYEFIYNGPADESLINSLITNITYKGKNLYLR